MRRTVCNQREARVFIRPKHLVEDKHIYCLVLFQNGERINVQIYINEVETFIPFRRNNEDWSDQRPYRAWIVGFFLEKRTTDNFLWEFLVLKSFTRVDSDFHLDGDWYSIKSLPSDISCRSVVWMAKYH